MRLMQKSSLANKFHCLRQFPAEQYRIEIQKQKIKILIKRIIVCLKPTPQTYKFDGKVALRFNKETRII
jgi:hypothetical protein